MADVLGLSHRIHHGGVIPIDAPGVVAPDTRLIDACLGEPAVS